MVVRACRLLRTDDRPDFFVSILSKMLPADYDVDWIVPSPFWFASAELLMALWRAESSAIVQLFAKYPDLRLFFDSPESTIPQRTACFELLTHRKVIESIDETLVGRYKPSPDLSEEETDVLRRSQNLVRSDAPAWALEMNEVAGWLLARIQMALPEPLHQIGWYRNDPARDEAVRSAAKALDTVEQIQNLIARVVAEQLQRLKERWSAALPLGREYPSSDSNDLPLKKPVKRKTTRTRDKVREKRDRKIAEIDDASETMTEFIRLMDERGVAPQPTWPGWQGSWAKAYKNNPRLRRLIHQDKYRALQRARRKK